MSMESFREGGNAIRAITGPHPLLKKYEHALRRLNLKPIRFPANMILGASSADGVSDPVTHEIALSPLVKDPRGTMLHEIAHHLFSHSEHGNATEMEAHLAALYAARKLGWHDATKHLGSRAAQHARLLRREDETLPDWYTTHYGKTGLNRVKDTYSPSGKVSQRVVEIAELIVSAFDGVHP